MLKGEGAAAEGEINNNSNLIIASLQSFIPSFKRNDGRDRARANATEKRRFCEQFGASVAKPEKVCYTDTQKNLHLYGRSRRVGERRAEAVPHGTAQQ